MKLPEEMFLSEFDKLKSQLYRFAFLYLRNEAMALEAVDETVFLAYKNIRKLRQPEYFKTWITSILINVCKKEQKHMKRSLPVDLIPEQPYFDMDRLPLKEAISKLPEDLKIIINLRYFCGYTIVETAQILKLAQGTVATRQRRALALLKLELEDEK